MFTLHLQAQDGSVEKILYNHHTSEMKFENGENAFEFGEITTTPKWSKYIPVSPDEPGKKNALGIKRLKIQLGLGCNYTCSYCLQADQVLKASATSRADADIFLKTLDIWLKSVPERIEFWGGEPLLYWEKIKILAPALKAKFPKADFLMITNGSLLTDEIIEKIIEWDFMVAISHDGPGQFIRGPDPLEDPEQRVMIDRLLQLRKGKISINSVLTPVSYDLKVIGTWFRERLGSEVALNLEGVVHSYDSGEGTTFFSPEQLSDMTQKIFLQIMDGSALEFGAVQQKIDQFVSTLRFKRPSEVIWQKCGMDKDDSLAVDLLGNVMTCQNTGAKGNHNIGHVRSFDKIALDTATHWSKREECTSCPVLQLCQGSCMYQEGQEWVNSCNSEYAFNMAMFAGALFFLTGKVLMKIDGNIIRPGNNPNP